MPEDYSKLKIKDYNYWSVFIHSNQSYLGRSIVWCNRENALDYTEATTDEVKELKDILVGLKKAAETCFQPDWFNYALLGNETRHLHCHFIPRYSSERNFSGVTFSDKLWGHNYRTDHSFVTPPDVLEKIQAKIKKVL